MKSRNSVRISSARRTFTATLLVGLAGPVVERVNTPYNPVDLKLRGRAVLGQGGLSVAAFFNYVDSYTDDCGPELLPIESWPTVDASMGYPFTSANGLLDGLSAMVSIINITDADPPFVAKNSDVWPGLNYDGTNTSPLGRQVSFQLTKRW